MWTDFLCFVLLPLSLNVLKQMSQVYVPFGSLVLDASAAESAAMPVEDVNADDGACDAAAAETSDAVSSSEGEDGTHAGVDAAAAKCSRSPHSESSFRVVVATGDGVAPLPFNKKEIDMAEGRKAGEGQVRIRFEGAPKSASEADISDGDRFKVGIDRGIVMSHIKLGTLVDDHLNLGASVRVWCRRARKVRILGTVRLVEMAGRVH